MENRSARKRKYLKKKKNLKKQPENDLFQSLFLIGCVVLLVFLLMVCLFYFFRPHIPPEVRGARTLLDFHAEEVARQLALIEMKQFRQIKVFLFFLQNQSL